MTEYEQDIEYGAVQNAWIIAQTEQKIPLQQCCHSPCAATAGTGEPCEGVEQTGRKEFGRNKISFMIEEGKKHKKRQNQKTSKIDAFFRVVGLFMHDNTSSVLHSVGRFRAMINRPYLIIVRKSLRVKMGLYPCQRGQEQRFIQKDEKKD